MTYRHQCCQCGKVTDGRGPILEGEIVSHGLCEECAERLHREIDAMIIASKQEAYVDADR